MLERVRKKAEANRKRVAEIKLKSGCVDCGYNLNHFVLEFDHRDNTGIPYSGKQKTVASMMHNAWDTICKEMEKCDIVCSNCHAVRTFTRRYNHT